MPGKLTIYPSRGASRTYVLREGQENVAGRDPACSVSLADARVSARHARLGARDGVWTVFDLDSKNGTIVNGVRAAELPLAHEDWISFGGLLARFEQISEEDVRALESERSLRLQTSTEIFRDLEAAPDARSVLRRLVESAIEVVGAERGCVLIVAPDGSVHGELAVGEFGTAAAADDAFRGSLGAIARVLESGEILVVADVRSDAFLASRRSVAEMGIGALACVPLRAEGAVNGLLYVDGRTRGGAFTELDLEILGTLSDHASLVLANIDIDRRIRELVGSSVSSAGDTKPSFFQDLAALVGALAPPGAAARARTGA